MNIVSYVKKGPGVLAGEQYATLPMAQRDSEKG